MSSSVASRRKERTKRMVEDDDRRADVLVVEDGFRILALSLVRRVLRWAHAMGRAR